MCESAYIVLGVLLLVAVIALAMLVRNIVRRKAILAKNILQETNPSSFTRKCDELFASAGDPVMSEQWQSMRNTRSVVEVNNLCGNYAKSVLGRKN